MAHLARFKQRRKKLKRQNRKMLAIERVLGGEKPAPPITKAYVALHTSDPTHIGRTTSEVSYTSYARVKKL